MIGKTVVVTGAAKRVGRSIARELHAAGANILIHYRTAIVDAEAIGLLFGCSSFEGADWPAHAPALALLRNHLAPAQWMPGPKAAEIFDFASQLRETPVDLRAAMQSLPPLLRTYLAMAGWVSDHAVLDRALDTLHVFTAVEIAKIPPARARALRAISE